MLCRPSAGVLREQVRVLGSRSQLGVDEAVADDVGQDQDGIVGGFVLGVGKVGLGWVPGSVWSSRAPGTWLERVLTRAQLVECAFGLAFVLIVPLADCSASVMGCRREGAGCCEAMPARDHTALEQMFHSP